MNTQADVHEPDTLATELEAMRQIARALDTLADPAARARVMRWAADRCTIAQPEFAAAQSAPPAAVVDPSLAVEELRDLFPELDAMPAPADAVVDRPAARVGVESMLRDFAADFRRFALEWQGA